MNIKLLDQKNWQEWKEIRLDALHHVPDAFASSFEEESLWSDEKFKLALDQNTIFGAFINNQLIGCAGFYQLNLLKTRHRGVIWGMYIKPEYRKKGIGEKLLDAIVKHAKPLVMQLHLTVVTTNEKAIKFYQQYGFKIYGIEPRSLKIGDHFYDEYFMFLSF